MEEQVLGFVRDPAFGKPTKGFNSLLKVYL